MDQASPVRAALDEVQLASLCSLDDPTRRRLYEHVAVAGEPVSRDQASVALGIDRSLVAYHLDRLAEEGLLTVSFTRPEGRGGPGAGRPAKHYQRAESELAVSVPARDYQLVAELLARAAEADTTGAVRHALDEAAAELGYELATSESARADLVEHLANQGYEPYEDGGCIRLRNCPFHRIARRHTELVCSMNLALLRALVTAIDERADAFLDPADARCCVAFTRPE